MVDVLASSEDEKGWDPLFGACGPMAVILHRALGWKTVGIYDDVWDTVPRHVGVVNPNGGFGDARGLDLSAEQFVASYQPSAHTRIAGIEPERISRIFRRPGSAYRHCRRVADRLLDRAAS